MLYGSSAFYVLLVFSKKTSSASCSFCKQAPQLKTDHKCKLDTVLCGLNPDKSAQHPEIRQTVILSPGTDLTPVVLDPDNSVELKKIQGLCSCTVTTGIKGKRGKGALIIMESVLTSRFK